MRLEELLKKFSFKDYKIIFRDLYANEYEKTDLRPETILKIESLEVRDVKIHFRLNKAIFTIIDLYELLRDEKKEGRF